MVEIVLVACPRHTSVAAFALNPNHTQ